MLTVQKVNRIPIEKVNQKQLQKTTPLGKTKIQLPMSVNRITHTPLNNQIITSVNIFLFLSLYYFLRLIYFHINVYCLNFSIPRH